jgi:hypothetical protein
MLAALRIFVGRQAAPMANPPATEPATTVSASSAMSTATMPATPSYRPPAGAPIIRLWLPGREAPPQRRPPPEAHAARLLRWVGEANSSGGMVLAADLQRLYPMMAEQLEWQPYNWQPIATCLRRLTGGGKPYRWVDGRHRRVYYIAPIMLVKLT